MLTRVTGCLMLTTGILIAGGCAEEEEPADWPTRIPVSGTVLYQGKPVDGATVLFHPQGDSPPAIGVTDAQGWFQLQTYRPGDGAVPGDYRVAIRKTEVLTPDGPPGDDIERPPPVERSLLPDRYAEPETSGLKETVTEGRLNAFTFDLEEGLIGSARKAAPRPAVRPGE